MPFRLRQHMQFYPAGVITYSVGAPNPDTGIVEYKYVEQNGPSAVLPDVDMTDLQSCLKAGVDLKKVNCKLISPDSHALAMRLGDIEDTEQTISSGEVEDEE